MNYAYLYTIAAGLLLSLGNGLKSQPGWLGWIGEGLTLAAPFLMGLATAHGDSKAAAAPIVASPALTQPGK
jgi:hypothetical protein